MISSRASRAARTATAALVAVVVLAACSGSSARHRAARATTGTTRAAERSTAAPPELQASLGARLPAPVSRAVVVAEGDRLIVLGGLSAGSSSVAGVYRVDPSTGASEHLGDLAVATHDAAGARIGGALL